MSLVPSLSAAARNPHLARVQQAAEKARADAPRQQKGLGAKRSGKGKGRVPTFGRAVAGLAFSHPRRQCDFSARDVVGLALPRRPTSALWYPCTTLCGRLMRVYASSVLGTIGPPACWPGGWHTATSAVRCAPLPARAPKARRPADSNFLLYQACRYAYGSASRATLFSVVIPPTAQKGTPGGGHACPQVGGRGAGAFGSAGAVAGRDGRRGVAAGQGACLELLLGVEALVDTVRPFALLETGSICRRGCPNVVRPAFVRLPGSKGRAQNHKREATACAGRPDRRPQS